MNKFVICCDIDGCINNLMEQTFAMYNERHGTCYSIDNLKTYSLEDNFSLETAEEIRNLFLEKDLWDSLIPVEGSQWALKSFINSGYKLYLATATHYTNFPWKVEWLKRYFDFIDPKDVICINDKSLLKCNVLIDDCYYNLTNTSVMVDRVLLDRPWNQASENKDYVYGINRANNWEEVVRCVNRIYKNEMEW